MVDWILDHMVWLIGALLVVILIGAWFEGQAWDEHVAEFKPEYVTSRTETTWQYNAATKSSFPVTRTRRLFKCTCDEGWHER